MATLPTSRQARGQIGEDLAARFLVSRGYQIVARNWRPTTASGKRSLGHTRGEIDIIAWHGEILCFIEVKTRSSNRFGAPQEAVNMAKQRQISRLANAYVSQNPTENSCRFDVVEVWLSDGETPRLALCSNAFDFCE